MSKQKPPGTETVQKTDLLDAALDKIVFSSDPTLKVVWTPEDERRLDEALEKYFKKG